MSEGRRSLVNWMRWNARPSERARACASVVFPTPGTSSIKQMPACQQGHDGQPDDVRFADQGLRDVGLERP